MKKLFSILALVCVFAGAAGAQTFSDGAEAAPSLLGPGANLDLLQYEGYPGYDSEAYQKQARGAWGAGLLNTLGGAWSWTHGDILGGAVTAGLEAAGVVLIIVGITATEPATLSSILLPAGGAMVAGGGAGFGQWRGMTQYRKQNPIAVGFNDNPIKHTSFVIAPDLSRKGGVTASLVYSTKL
ncbi:MAG: hypothetical protein LBR23_05030 [Spirochaetaceae bacterium]|jgi:hypothetical protein|nr:hypothetical protein [Spirochaetaceae bacterium]